MNVLDELESKRGRMEDFVKTLAQNDIIPAEEMDFAIEAYQKFAVIAVDYTPALLKLARTAERIRRTLEEDDGDIPAIVADRIYEELGECLRELGVEV